MRSTPNRFVGVLAPRTTPSIRPGKGNADSPLRSYFVVAPKDTGGRTRRCLQPHVHPVDRKTSRPTPSFNLGTNGEEAGLTNTVLRSTGSSEVQANHTEGPALTGNGKLGPAAQLSLRRGTPSCSAIDPTPSIRPGKGNADSPLRSYFVVAPKDTGGRTRRCL